MSISARFEGSLITSALPPWVVGKGELAVPLRGRSLRNGILRS